MDLLISPSSRQFQKDNQQPRYQMAKVCVTGATGFIGSELIRRLLKTGLPNNEAVTSLLAVDRKIQPHDNAWSKDERVHCLSGDFGSDENLGIILGFRPDYLFHLASIPGSAAEKELHRGIKTNLLAPLNLFSGFAESTSTGGSSPRIVFASSIAVYGPLDPNTAVTDSTTPKPQLSYGTHKLMTELFLNDLSRHKLLDAISLRIPGVVARPLVSSGHGSSFMSEIIRRLAAGDKYNCPVSASAQTWWLSMGRCVDNLIHAAGIDSEQLHECRQIQIPALVATVGQVVEAMTQVNPNAASLISYSPQPDTEEIFGRYPDLSVPYSLYLGFRERSRL